jgi:hypothetical protein
MEKTKKKKTKAEDQSNPLKANPTFKQLTQNGPLPGFINGFGMGGMMGSPYYQNYFNEINHSYRKGEFIGRYQTLFNRISWEVKDFINVNTKGGLDNIIECFEILSDSPNDINFFNLGKTIGITGAFTNYFSYEKVCPERIKEELVFVISILNNFITEYNALIPCFISTINVHSCSDANKKASVGI